MTPPVVGRHTHTHRSNDFIIGRRVIYSLSRGASGDSESAGAVNIYKRPTNASEPRLLATIGLRRLVLFFCYPRPSVVTDLYRVFVVFDSVVPRRGFCPSLGGQRRLVDVTSSDLRPVLRNGRSLCGPVVLFMSSFTGACCLDDCGRFFFISAGFRGDCSSAANLSTVQGTASSIRWFLCIRPSFCYSRCG